MPTKWIFIFAIGMIGVIILSAAQPSKSAGATRIIAREGTRKIVAIPPSGGQPQTLFLLRRGALISIAASRNGRRVAFASRNWDKSTGAPVWTDRVWTMRLGRRARVIRSFVSSGITRADIPIDSIALAPNGGKILVTKRAGAVFILKANGSHLHRVVVPGYSFEASGGRNSSGAEFTADGRHIIAVFRSTGQEGPVNGIGTTGLNGGSVNLLHTGPFRAGLSFAAAPTMSANNRLIAFATADRAGARIVVMRRDGSHAHRLPASQVAGWTAANPSFSPSGNALTFSGEKLSGGGVDIGVSPSCIFTIRVDGSRRRTARCENARRVPRNPLWTRWPF